MSATVLRISGSLVVAGPLPAASLYELAHVGHQGLLGEVIRVDGDRATIQVYEDTTGLAVGEPAEGTGATLTIPLGPGLLGSVIDGVGRPLRRVAESSGDFIRPGVAVPTLDPAERWSFTPARRAGERVAAGDLLGVVMERPGFEHRVLVPPGVAGVIARLDPGSFTVDEVVGSLDDGTPLRLAHAWPVRRARPFARRLPATIPFLTGQRVFDFLFPVAEGGTVAVPGGFGTGKTVIEQSLAKYASADVVVYIGCGERGNEMADVLHELPSLVDLRTGRSIMDRTVLVVNTSNMPVAAREASVYVGMTIAEYYRDMGYRVALMADSLSRWAEALREIGARLREMPGEEGYPTYLGNRLARFYERAGRIEAEGSPVRTGAVTLIAAISPPGGDFSEPVTQAVLRVAGALWALDAGLAHQRQFPAVDWETSYSLQADGVAPWFAEHVGDAWPALRTATLALMQKDRELRDIASLVGPEALQDPDRLLLETARIMRELVLGQSAYEPEDASSPPAKTLRLAQLAYRLHEAGMTAINRGVPLDHVELSPVRTALAALRSASDDERPERDAAAEHAILAIAG